MSPHHDVSAPLRWRTTISRLRAGVLALALGAALTATSGVALAETAAAASKSSQTLKYGSKGAAVKQLQRKLKVRPASGYYGSETARAVKFFQQRRGLTADGIAGPATLRALGINTRAASNGGATPSDGGGKTRLPAVLKRIAQCESGGNPRAVSPSGKYRGKFQFDQATWEAYGGKGDPAKAPESVQDRIALKLYRARGTAPWPNCA
jgi:peptidoglycan hydrolase-like protein with peptidoglycan-binding domain